MTDPRSVQKEAMSTHHDVVLAPGAKIQGIYATPAHQPTATRFWGIALVGHIIVMLKVLALLVH